MDMDSGGFQRCSF